jgi:uridine kinase
MQNGSIPSSVVIIGVSGGSGSGKTTFARMLQANLNENFCGILSQDSYYRDMSAHFDRDGGKVNFDHPESIEFSLMAEHLQKLKNNDDVLIPQYDFVSHKRRDEHCLFVCRPVVIVDGILILSQPRIRELLDFAFFIETSEELRFQRRLYRDTRERGRTSEGVRMQFEGQVKPMHDHYVEPSKVFADRRISGEISFGPSIHEIVFGLRQQTTRVAGSL